MKILFVEDMENWHRAFKDGFSSSEYELEITDNIDKAEKIITEYDIAIININLEPEISLDGRGKRLLAYIQDNYPLFPRIVLTGNPGSLIISELYHEFDVDEVIIKAIYRPEDLVKAIDIAIQRRKNGQTEEAELQQPDLDKLKKELEHKEELLEKTQKYLEALIVMETEQGASFQPLYRIQLKEYKESKACYEKEIVDLKTRIEAIQSSEEI